jgi:hypothetical protein
MHKSCQSSCPRQKWEMDNYKKGPTHLSLRDLEFYSNLEFCLLQALCGKISINKKLLRLTNISSSRK